ncbi:hypothetical protein K1719_017588 [Acacia pycnantha]|nr:hypothetical protein K1719_017588 [Acacia pycnantha]
MMSRWRGVPRNDDAGDTRDQKSIFNFPGRVVGKRSRSTLDERDKRLAEWYILNNCEEAAQYLKLGFQILFLAEQITSQVQAFRNFEFYICYYGLGEHSRREEKCQSRGVYNTLSFIIGVVPFWFRFSQCMRRLYDEGDMSRAWNGLSDLLTIFASLRRTAFELKKGMTWKVLALITSSITAIQNTYGDIFLDWGLLRRHSKNPYLRDKLLLPHKSVYFIAMLVLQLTWRPLQKVVITTIITCLEIIRRGIWNFFRVEKEYLNNIGKYRPFKSVPHPFTYYKQDSEEENNKDE